MNFSVKECRLEVEAVEGNTELGDGYRRAIVNLYLRDSSELNLEQAVRDACEFMGLELKAIQNVQTVDEDDIPEEAIENFRKFSAGFGVFQVFPDDH